MEITYAATVLLLAREDSSAFFYAPAYADLRISGFYLRACTYDHLPSYYMKGGL